MAQFGRPSGDVAAGSWGNTPLWSKIDSGVAAPDDVNITSADNTSPDNADFSLSSTTDPGVSTGHIIRALWRKGASGGHTVNAVLELWQGVPGTGTLIATLTVAGISETEQTSTHTLTGTEADNITDYSNLHFRLSRQGDTGGNPSTRRALVVDEVELEVPDASVDRRGRISAYETETPNAPRQVRVSAYEVETTNAPRSVRISAYEVEVPVAPRLARVSSFETEVPNAPRKARTSAFEVEVPDAPRKSRVSAFEFEAPDAGSTDRRSRVSAFETETPEAPRSSRISAFEFETVDAVRKARISAYELESPEAPRAAQVSGFEFGAPETSPSQDRRVRISGFALYYRGSMPKIIDILVVEDITAIT